MAHSKQLVKGTFVLRGKTYPNRYLEELENTEIWEASTNIPDCEMLYLGDSIIKYTSGIVNTQVVAYKGINVAQLGARIMSHKIPYIHGKRLILLHVGTNNVEYNDSQEIIEQFQYLVNVIRHQVPDINIAISHIIQRPKDYLQTSMTVWEVNTKLDELKEAWDVQTLPVFSKFTHCSAPVVDYFAIDGIHLKKNGIDELSKYIMKMMGQLRVNCAIPRVKDVYPPTVVWQKIKKHSLSYH
jgi:hypothetical protein